MYQSPQNLDFFTYLLFYCKSLLCFFTSRRWVGEAGRENAVLPLFVVVVVAILKTLNCFLLRVFSYGSQIFSCRDAQNLFFCLC